MSQTPNTYLGRDYGSHLRQHREWIEHLGYGPDADDRAEHAEQDLHQDLAAERAGVSPKLGLKVTAPAAATADAA